LFKAHRRVYHSTLGLGVIKKKKKKNLPRDAGGEMSDGPLGGLRWFRCLKFWRVT